MKASEFITEDRTDDIQQIALDANLDEDIVEFAIEVGTRCKPFLKMIDYKVFDYLLLRCMKNRNEAFTEESVQLSSRKPRDMELNLHDKLNELFVEKFGEPFRNALFATGDEEQADFYGTIYAMIPVGEFTFCWSPKLRDLQTKWEDIEGQPSLTNAYRPSVFLNTVADSDYQTTNMKAAINSEHEIMIRCDSVLGMSELKVLKVLSDTQKNAMIKIMRLM